MNIDPYIVLGSAVIGFLVGLTGAGGGALMTPMLILLFNVKPSTAISSDLVAAVFMRPFGAAVHMTKKTVNFSLVGWMVCGSVPMAFLGAYLLHLLGHAKTSQANIEKALGAALDRGCGHGDPISARPPKRRRSDCSDSWAGSTPAPHCCHRNGRWIGRRHDIGRIRVIDDRHAPLSLPNDRSEPVGRHCLTQAVPLTAAAALGALAFGHVEFSVTTSIIIGSVPAVIVGSFISSRA